MVIKVSYLSSLLIELCNKCLTNNHNIKLNNEMKYISRVFMYTDNIEISKEARCKYLLTQ